MSRWNRLDAPASRFVIGVLAMTGATLLSMNCGGDTTGNGGETGTSSTTGTTTGTGGTGTGGTGTGGNVVVGPITTATPVAVDAAHALVFDSTLSADGSIVYFTGVGPNGPGVFSIPAAGGAVVKIAEGSPFAAPFGIALSTDGKKLYVADPGAEGSALDHGRILAVDAEGGAITPLMAADDLSPRGVDVVAENGQDQVYFTGNAATGAPTIFKVAASGGAATAVVSGAPLVDPQGIAVTKAGVVYIVDAIGGKTGRGAVFQYDGTTLGTFQTEIAVGYPSGIALGLDEKAIFVSSFDPKSGAASLLVVDILSKEPTNFPTDTSLAGKLEPGGIHRARNAQRFAWVSYDPTGPSVLLVK